MNQINVIDDAQRYKIGKRVTWITIIINIFLAGGKIFVGIVASSTAMLADGIHTVSDIASSVGIIVGFFIAKKPEDREHQYGHEKAESIAGFILSLLLIGVGIRIGYSAIGIMFSGERNVPGVLALWAAIISIVVKEIQYRIALHGGRRINSSALIADAWHHRSDALSSVGALIGIGGARLGYTFLDPLAGLMVAVIVVKVGVDIFRQGYNELMDTSIDSESYDKLANQIISKTRVSNINEIRTRRHGAKVFVDVKICVNPTLSVAKGHSIAEEVEEVVYATINNAKDVLVHVNPCDNPEDLDCHLCTKGWKGSLKKV